MNLLWAAVGGAVGLVAGYLLRGPVFRLSVPAGVPDRVACPGCDTRLRSRPSLCRWPSLRCWHCGRALGTPAVLELATAAVLALLAGRFGGQPLTSATSAPSGWPLPRSTSASSGCPAGSRCPPTRC